MNQTFTQKRIPFYCIFSFGLYGFYMNNLNFIIKHNADQNNQSAIINEVLNNKIFFENMLEYYFSLFSKHQSNFNSKKILNKIAGISFILMLLINYLDQNGSTNEQNRFNIEKFEHLIQILTKSRKDNTFNEDELNQANLELPDELHYLKHNQEIFENLIEHYR